MTTSRCELAAMIDHTLLRPEAVPSEIVALCEEAVRLEVHAVCVSPIWVGLAADHLRGRGIRVAAVIGFPSGAHQPQIKAAEAARAAADGTDEADMVMNLGLAFNGDWKGVTSEIAGVRKALDDRQLLKVIIESALLSSGQIKAACHAVEAGGADFVKSSTGFHPAGGATTRAIEIMSAAVGQRLGVKASGGIRDARSALAMIDAGATRLGLSSSAAVLDGLDRLAVSR